MSPPPDSSVLRLPRAHGGLLAEFFYDPPHELLTITWHGYLGAEDVAQVAEAELRLQKTMRCTRLLNNKLDASGDWSEVLPLLEYEWLPSALALHLRAMAYVVSPDATSRIMSERFVLAVRPRLAIELFDTEASAWDWLRAQG
jgi:hypothetical protein